MPKLHMWDCGSWALVKIKFHDQKYVRNEWSHGVWLSTFVGVGVRGGRGAVDVSTCMSCSAVFKGSALKTRILWAHAH